MGTIKAKQRSTMSKSHHTCTKANEDALESTCFRVDVELHRAPGVGAVNFRAVFGKRAISIFMGAVDEFDCTFSGSIGFVVANNDSIKVFEMVLNDLRLDGRIGADFGKDFGCNELRFDVTVPVVMDSVTSVSLNRCTNLPSIRCTHCSCVKIPRWSKMVMMGEDTRGIPTRRI